MADSSRADSNPEVRWFFRTFGGLKTEPTAVKFRTRKTEAFAAYLALVPGTLRSRDTLAGLFWPESPPDTARQSVRMAISNLRSLLGEDALIVEGQKVGFNSDRVSSDISEFESLIDQAGRDTANAKALRQKAFDLASEPWLPDIDADWVSAQTPRVLELAAENAVQLIELLRKDKELSQAIQIGKRALEIVGFREDLHICLIQLYVDSGLNSLALAQFEILEKQLDDLWGEPPSAAAIAAIEAAPRTIRDGGAERKPTTIKGLFGRESELTELVSTLTDGALPLVVSLVGTGGCGKTALANATRKLLEEAGTTVHFVGLTTSTSMTSALEQIISDLNIANLDPAEALSAVQRFINKHNDVYVFDNLEQMGDEGTLLVQSITSHCSKARILVTSRTPTHVDGEQVIYVKPLGVPKDGASLEEVRQSSAVQFFERQASHSNPNFSLTSQNAASVVALCRRLDGLPLAIKLAGARTVVRTPAQILASLHSSLDSIRSTKRPKEDRHSNIRSTVEWSFQLLSEPAQQAALAWGLFAGPFTEQMAMALFPDGDYLQTLEELVNTSLLNVDSSSETTHFWFFETVRAALNDILGQGEHYHKSMDLLLQYCIERFEQIEAKTSQPGWKIVREHLANSENTLRCLEFAIQKQAFDASAALLAVKFQRVLTLYNNERIGPILERFFDWPNGNDSAPLRAHIGCAIIHSISNSGQVEKQSQLVERCEALAEGDDEATIDVRFCKSNIYKVKGEYPEAIAEMEWVLARTDTNDDHLMANRLYRQGLNYGCLNDRDKTFYYFSNALPYARRAQDVNMIIRLLFDLGSEYAHLKDGDKAIECFVEAETLCESVGSRKLEGLTRWQHGDALIDLNQPAEALELLKQSIKLVYEGNFPAAEKWIFIKAAQAAHECGFSVLSAKLLGKGVHVREEEKRTLAVYETNYVESLTEKLRSKLGDHEFKRHKFEGIQSDWQTLWSEFDSLNSTGR